jgi:hypothetical protein
MARCDEEVSGLGKGALSRLGRCQLISRESVQFAAPRP